MRALPPCIPSKSRMRERARTDLCGGVEQSASLPRPYGPVGGQFGYSDGFAVHHPLVQGVNTQCAAGCDRDVMLSANGSGLLTPTLCANPIGRISTVRESSSSMVANRLSDTHRQQGSNRHPTIDDELGAYDKG